MTRKSIDNKPSTAKGFCLQGCHVTITPLKLNPEPSVCCRSQALVLDKKQPLPQLGLAQMSVLQSGELTNAISMLEKALEQNPGWNDAVTVRR